MTDRYPSAVLFSAFVHAVVVGALLWFTYALNQQQPDPVKVFELVAGEGDNFAATEAPALGKPGGVTLTVPEIPMPEPAVEPAPQRVEVVQAPPEPAPKPTPKVADAIPDFSQQVKRTADRKEARLEQKYKAEAAKKAKAEAAERARTLTKAEFDKQNKAKATAAKTPAVAPKIARIDGEGIAQGVIGGSPANKTGGARGKALTREQGNALEAWEAMLKQRLRENLEKPVGVSDLLMAIASVRVASDGTLSEGKIWQASGSDEFDQAVLGSIARTRMPPRPDGKGEVLRIPFRMRDEAN